MGDIRSDRRLASVLFADIVGFTKIMGANEDRARRTVDEFKTTCQPIVVEEGGLWLKDLGDGALCSFNSALAAVKAAIKMQQSLIKNDFQLRIGIHLGDVTFVDGDILGDGVNIAARVQAEAVPGSIFISEPIFQSVANKPSITAAKVARKKLKNVKNPLVLYQIIAPGVANKAHEKPALSKLWMVGLFSFGIFCGILLTNFWNTGDKQSRQAIKFDIEIPDGYSLNSRPAISQDGSVLAFTATHRNDTAELFIHYLDSLFPIPVLKTRSLDTETPFFSPDSKWLGFHQSSSIWKLSLESNDLVKICDQPSRTLHSAFWRSDDSIFLASASAFYGITKVSAYGGNPVPYTIPNDEKSELSHTHPSRGSNKNDLLITISTPSGPVVGYIGSMMDSAKVVVDNAQRPLLFKGNKLFFGRNDEIFGTTYDRRNNSPGEVIDLVLSGSTSDYFDISENGTLIYSNAKGNQLYNFLKVDFAGNELPVFDLVISNAPFAMSPDGNTMLYTRDGDIWSWNTNQQSSQRLTTEAGNWYPVWSPNGDRFIYGSNMTGNLQLYEMDVDGESSRVLDWPYSTVPVSWSSDGRQLLFYEVNPETGRNLLILDLLNSSVDTLLATPYDERAGQFSPDGKWFTYVSDITGQDEVYIKPLQKKGGSIRISRSGGTEPMWSQNGRQLFFRNDDEMYSAMISTEDLELKSVNLLWKAKYRSNLYGIGDYEIVDGGNSFLFVRIPDSANRQTINVILNWSQTLPKSLQ